MDTSHRMIISEDYSNLVQEDAAMHLRSRLECSSKSVKARREVEKRYGGSHRRSVASWVGS